MAANSGKFVGRVQELARLLDALKWAEQGQPAMVLVSGDAGIGKTRLLLEFAERAQQRGGRVLSGGCVQLGDIGLAYLPILDALHGLADDPAEAELLAEVATTAPGLGRLLPGVAGLGPTGAPSGVVDQLQILDAVRALLLRRSQQSPVVVVLEDLHWADRSTLDLIAFLARTLRSGRVVLVASYRSDELHRRHPLRLLLAELVRLPGVERLELGPLNGAELAEQLEGIAGGPLAPDRLVRIHARSEGNPFYAEQLVAAGAGRAEVALSPTLLDVVLVRVQALPEPAQQLLRVAAVAGRRVSHRLLAQVAGWPEPDLEQALSAAVAGGVLVADQATGTYVFRHALLQEAIYGDLLPGEQVRLHAAYARGLASAEGAAAELAHHCRQSHDLVGALAASMRAAGEAAAVLAPAETLRHLSTALKLWEGVPDPAGVTGTNRVDLTLEAATAAAAAGDPQQAVALAQEAAAIAEATADLAQAARAYEQLGWHLLQAQQDTEGLRACARAVELVPAEPPTPLRARVTATLAWALLATGQYGDARYWCDQALAAARGAGSAEDEAHALLTLGRIQAFDDPAGARRLYAEVQAWAAEAGNREIELRMLRQLAWLEYTLGNLAAARAVYDHGAELAQRSGQGWSQSGIMMRRGQILIRYFTGAWDDCEQLAAGCELVTTLGTAWLVLEGLVVSVARGQAAAANRLREVAVLAAIDPALNRSVAVVQAELAIWQGDLEGARLASQRAVAAIDAIKALDQPFFLVWVCSVGLTVAAERAEQARRAGAAAALGDASGAGDALLEQLRVAVGQAEQVGLAQSGFVRGWHAKAEAEWTRLRGRSDPARWQAAVEAFSFGCVYEVARCQWRLAEALLGAGQREQAAEAARAAYQTAVRLEAAPLRAALDALARRARLDLGAGVPQAPGAVGLTPRELEVLHLLVAGRSNRQIAEQLFISGKTATAHVTNILVKLGVHSRLEAAARARELGLDHPASSSRR